MINNKKERVALQEWLCYIVVEMKKKDLISSSWIILFYYYKKKCTIGRLLSATNCKILVSM